MKECPMCSAKAIDDAEVCHACLRRFDEAANAEEDHGEAWEPDLDFVREWAEGKTRERHADLPSLTPWQRMEVEGTVAYAVETWYGAGDAWAEAWGESPELPAWDDLDGDARNRALSAAAYEHFVADVEWTAGRFVERMQTANPADMLKPSNRRLGRSADTQLSSPPRRRDGADGKGSRMEKERACGMDEGCAEVAALLDGEQEKLDAIAAEYGFTWDADNMTEFDVGGPDGCKWEDGEAVDRALDVIVGICLACHALGFETGKGEDGKWRCAPSAG